MENIIKKLGLIAVLLFGYKEIQAVIIDKHATDLESLNEFNLLFKKDDYVFFNIKNGVKVVCTTIKKGIEEKFGEIVDDNARIKESYYEFDKNGKVIKHSVFENNVKETVYTWIYDTQGKLLEEKKIKFDHVTKYFYNESNLLIQQDFLEKNTLTGRYLYKYDNVNNPIEINYYDETGKLKRNSTYRYENNLLIEELINDYVKLNNEKKSEIIKYNYDNQGRIINKEHITDLTNEDGQNVYAYTDNFIYDYNGNKIKHNSKTIIKHFISKEITRGIKVIGYEEDGKGNQFSITVKVEQTLYKYNQNNKIVESIGDSQQTYTNYDKNGNVVSIEYYKKGELEKKILSVYDENNNLLTKIIDTYGNFKGQKKEVNTYDDNKNLSTLKLYENGLIKSLIIFKYVLY